MPYSQDRLRKILLHLSSCIIMLASMGCQAKLANSPSPTTPSFQATPATLHFTLAKNGSIQDSQSIVITEQSGLPPASYTATFEMRKSGEELPGFPSIIVTPPQKVMIHPNTPPGTTLKAGTYLVNLVLTEAKNPDQAYYIPETVSVQKPPTIQLTQPDIRSLSLGSKETITAQLIQKNKLAVPYPHLTATVAPSTGPTAPKLIQVGKPQCNSTSCSIVISTKSQAPYPKGTTAVLQKITLTDNDDPTNSVTKRITIRPNIMPPSARTYAQNPMRGVNLGGGGYSGYNYNDQYHGVPYGQDAAWFIRQGANTFRIPLSWETLARTGPGKSAIDKHGTINLKSLYLKHELELIEQLSHIKNVHIIVDLHNYDRFSTKHPEKDHNEPDNTDVIGLVKGHYPSRDDYVAAWETLNSQIENDTNIIQQSNIIYELMNEPYSATTSGKSKTQHTDAVSFDNSLAENYFQVIKSITTSDQKLKRPQRQFMVSGGNWASIGLWELPTDDPEYYTTPTQNAINLLTSDIVKTATDPATTKTAEDIINNLIVDVHAYFDIHKKQKNQVWASGKYDAEGCTPGEGKISKDVTTIENWMENSPVKFHDGTVLHLHWFLGETGIPYYDSTAANNQCRADIEAVLSQAINPNATSYFAGFTLWAAGHSWGSLYSLNLSPGACQLHYNASSIINPNTPIPPNTITPKASCFMYPSAACSNAPTRGSYIKDVFTPISSAKKTYLRHEPVEVPKTFKNYSKYNLLINHTTFDNGNPIQAEDPSKPHCDIIPADTKTTKLPSGYTLPQPVIDDMNISEDSVYFSAELLDSATDTGSSLLAEHSQNEPNAPYSNLEYVNSGDTIKTQPAVFALGQNPPTTKFPTYDAYHQAEWAYCQPPAPKQAPEPCVSDIYNNPWKNNPGKTTLKKQLRRKTLERSNPEKI